MIYIFDIDGTLTPSRNPIDKKFKEDFLNFCNHNKVWLVTGSDKDKSVEQLGEDAWLAADRVYQSCGNQLWMEGKVVRQSEWSGTDYLDTLLNMMLDRSEYPHRFGNHIEKRIGLVNFSVVGRNCTQEQRNEYFKWDQEHQERKSFAEEICDRYTWLDASIGGEISIDIHEKGADKGQILDDLNGDNFTFFGDNLFLGGNDYAVKEATIRKKLTGNTFHHVESWKDTRDLLYSIMTEGII
jgi:phosphomannomutase